MDQTFSWELSKENIQPLRHGRNASQLFSALNEDHAKQTRLEQRKAFEASIMSYTGEDPLDGWSRYIKWVEETYPQGGNESGLLTVLEKCLEKVRDRVQYQSDSRLLEIYLRYLDLTDSNVEWFQMLYAGGYFHQLASFYINWADKLEAVLNFKEATKVYQLGFSNQAEPHFKLDEHFKKYQARVADAVLNGKTGIDENNEPTGLTEGQRQAFGELETVSDDRRVPVVRSGTSLRKFQNNRLLPSSSSRHVSNKQMTIHADENGQVPSSAFVPGKIAMPIHSTIKVENTHKATKWSEVTVFSEPVSAPSQPKIQVHVDEVAQPTPRKTDSSFISALRDKPVAPPRLNPQSLFEAENPKVRLMCDLNKIYVANREFCFEEIRAQCCHKNVRTPKVSRVLAPVNDEPTKSPSKPKIIDQEVKIDPAPAAAPVFNPREHLKPNERMHCDLDAIYSADGSETSLEQLRARIYARRTERRPPVRQIESETPIQPPVGPSVSNVNENPVSTKQTATCDASVQTDLAGLEFDLVLVPRAKAAAPLSPKCEPEREKLDQTAAPSPTIHTKNALSNVKNWFNGSMLVESRPHTKVDPDPPRKAAFAVFKDPTILESADVEPAAPKKAAFSIFKDPSFVEPARDGPAGVKNAFEIFQDPSVVAEQPNHEPRLAEQPAFTVYADPSAAEPTKKSGFAVFVDENNCTNHVKTSADCANGDGHREALKSRKPLVPIDPTKAAEDPDDDFKENVAPCNYIQEKSDRPLAGILQPSTNVPFDPEAVQSDEIEEESPPVPSVHRALFADDDETRYFSAPLSDNVDFTIPSVTAFARNLNRGQGIVQSTPFASREPPAFVDDDVTSVVLLQRHKQPSAAGTESSENKAEAAPTGNKIRRRLSDIGEASHECYSSSGSSTGSAGLTLSSRLSVGRSLHSHFEPPARIYPPSYDPFDKELRQDQLTTLSNPLASRSGFHAVCGRFPWLRSNCSIQLGGHIYFVKSAIGQGAYAKIYEASDASLGPDAPRIVLKVQDDTGLWEFYVASELRQRLGHSPIESAVMAIEKGYFYETGSILVNQYVPYGTLLGLVNHYRLKNSSMPEVLVFYFALELLAVVDACHSHHILHADIKADNIMLQSLPNLPQQDWTLRDLLLVDRPSIKLIDFGRSIDLSFYPDKSAFQHCFTDDKCPEMRDGRPWSYQLDYYGVATTIYTLLMGTHCKIVQESGKWKVPTLKRGHSEIWRDLTTELLNAPTSAVPLDLEKWRNHLARNMIQGVTKPRDFHDKVREVERYFSSFKA